MPDEDVPLFIWMNVVLPWNLQEEVSQQLSYIREWGAQFVVVQPNFRIW
jgi:hypothetical protein